MRPLAAAGALAALALASPARAWDYFEHRYLGDLACEKARGGEAACIVAAAPDPAQAITFGDLVALAGDHAGDRDRLDAMLARYLEALASCPASGHCEALETQDLGQVLRAREFQLAGVATWLAASPGRRRRLGTDLPAWLTRAAPPAASGSADAAGPPGGPPLPEPQPGERRVARGGALDATAVRNKVNQSSLGADLLEKTGTAGLDRALREGEWLAQALETTFTAFRGDCYLGGADEEALFAQLRNYPELAAKNYDHFGEAAHQRARAELLAARALPAGRARDVALGFALHFATDSHAAGHLRTQRRRLSNTEAKRRHDFDNAYGLIVYAPEGEGGVVWQTYGDDCLLGLAGGPSRKNAAATARALLAEASPGALDSLPRPSPQNDPVPDPAQFLEVAVEPGFGAVRPARAHLEAAFSGRWTLQVNLHRAWSPPRITQGVLLWPGGQAFVPISAEPIGLLAWLWSLPGAGAASDADIDRAQRRIRWLPSVARWANLAFEPMAGLALARTGGGDRLWPALHAGALVRYDVYAGTAFHLGLETVSGRPWAFLLTAGVGQRVH